LVLLDTSNLAACSAAVALGAKRVKWILRLLIYNWLLLEKEIFLSGVAGDSHMEYFQF
jgi:hypothetical protein